MREVAVVGAGMTPFAEHFALGIKDLVPMAFAECAASIDKGLDKGDIQAAWFGELSTTDGFPSGILADTLGLDLSVFEQTTNSRSGDLCEARAMNTVLWPATWGYFLSQMVGFEGSGLTLDGRDFAREHAVDHVRPGGPMPLLRIGRQPYGVLPVTSLDMWQGEGMPLRNVVVRLRDAVFRPAAATVPRPSASWTS
jgi:hypothetical protein